MDFADTLYKLGVVIDEIERRSKGVVAKSASIDKKLPHVLDVLVANGRITPEQRGVAAAMIKDADRCLDFIELLAKHRTGDGVSKSLGVPISRSNANSINRAIGAPIVDFDETEAGRMLRDVITTGRFGM